MRRRNIKCSYTFIKIYCLCNLQYFRNCIQIIATFQKILRISFLFFEIINISFNTVSFAQITRTNPELSDIAEYWERKSKFHSDFTFPNTNIYKLYAYEEKKLTYVLCVLGPKNVHILKLFKIFFHLKTVTTHMDGYARGQCEKKIYLRVNHENEYSRKKLEMKTRPNFTFGWFFINTFQVSICILK